MSVIGWCVKLQVEYHSTDSSTRHSVISLKMNMAQLEQQLKLGLVPPSDVNNLLAILRKTVQETPMVHDFITVIRHSDNVRLKRKSRWLCCRWCVWPLFSIASVVFYWCLYQLRRHHSHLTVIKHLAPQKICLFISIRITQSLSSHYCNNTFNNVHFTFMLTKNIQVIDVEVILLELPEMYCLKLPLTRAIFCVS